MFQDRLKDIETSEVYKYTRYCFTLQGEKYCQRLFSVSKRKEFQKLFQRRIIY